MIIYVYIYIIQYDFAFGQLTICSSNARLLFSLSIKVLGSKSGAQQWLWPATETVTHRSNGNMW